jgi:hypothetical protein
MSKRFNANPKILDAGGFMNLSIWAALVVSIGVSGGTKMNPERGSIKTTKSRLSSKEKR